MSASIDKRIVEMEMDNTQFEKGAKETISTLDKLKESLDFSGHADTLKNLSDNLGNVNSTFRPISNTIDSIADKFSIFGEIASGALTKIGMQAVETAETLLKSLTIDPLMQSWSKYDQAIASQQSIMSAVEGKTDANGNAYDMDAVIQRVEKLKWYADETSYSIDQMTNAVGQFTASGQDLDVSVNAVMGIANACADAGVSTKKAESAFLGFSKAIGSGTLTLGTWNMQLKTSGITNSERFRNSLLETAAAMGTLRKEADGTYRTLGDNELVNTANFTEYLKDGIITSDVLIKTLNTFADTTDAVKEIAGGDITAITDIFKTSGKEMSESMKKTVKSIEEDGTTASQAIETLTKAYEEAGVEVPKSLKALRRAQEAISFSQAIDATKEAMTSQFSNIFELLFGNYEEAKKLWSALADDLNGWFVTPLYDLVDVFTEVKNMWKKSDFWSEDEPTQMLAIYNEFSEIINTLIDIFGNLTSEVKEAFGIADISAESIFNFLENIRKSLFNLLKEINGSKWFKGITEVFKAMYSTILLIYNAGKKVINEFFKPLIDKVAPIIKEVAEIFGDIGEAIFGMNKNISDSDFPRLTAAMQLLLTILNPIIEGIKTVVHWINLFTDSLRPADETTGEFNKKGSILADIINSIREAFEKLGEKIGPIFDKIKDFVNKGLTGLASMNILEKIGQGFTWIFENLGRALEFVMPLLSEIANTAIFATLATGFSKIAKVVGEKGITGLFGSFGELGNNISEMFKALGDGIKNLFGGKDKDFGEKLKTLAIGIGLLAVSLKILDSIEPERIASSLAALGAVLLELIGYVSLMGSVLKGNTSEQGGIFSKIFGKTKTNDLSTASKGIIKLGAGLLVLAAALKLLSTMDVGQLAKSLSAMMIVLLELAAFAKLTNGISMKGSSGVIALAAGLIIISGALAILAAIDSAKIAGALAVVSALILEIGLLFKALDSVGAGSMLAIGAAILLISDAMLVLSASLAVLSLLKPEKLVIALAAVSFALLEMAAILALLSQVENTGDLLVVAGSMVILAAAIDLLTPALALLSLIPGAKLAKALITVAAALTIFGVAAYAIGPETAAVMIAIGAAVALLGVGALAAGTGILALSAAILGLSAAGSSVIGFINLLMTSIIGFIPLIIEAIGKGIIRVLKMFTELGSTLKNLVITYISAMCEAIIVSVPKILEAVRVILDAGIALFIEYIPQIIDCGILLITELCRGITETVPLIVETAVNVIIAFIDGIADMIDEIIDAGFRLVEAFIDGMADAIENHTGPLVDSFLGLGKAAIDGLVDGLFSGVKKIGESIWDLGKTAINGLKNVLGIHSPSKEFMKIGKLADQGLAKGIEDYSYLSDEASADLGKKSVKSLSKVLSKIGEGIDSDMNLNPTITPVLDLSNIEEGNGLISSLLNGTSIGANIPVVGIQNGGKLAGANGITINLNNSFDITNGQNIDRETVRSWSSWIASDINEELGRRT